LAVSFGGWICWAASFLATVPLNRDLLLRQLEDAVLQELVADLAEDVGELIRGQGRRGVGRRRLLRLGLGGGQKGEQKREMRRGQQKKARSHRERRPPDFLHMLELKHLSPGRGLRARLHTVQAFVRQESGQEKGCHALLNVDGEGRAGVKAHAGASSRASWTPKG
jgi:hypothetical protein